MTIKINEIQSKLNFTNIVAHAPLQQICHPSVQSVSISSACESQWLRIGKEGKRKVFGPSTRARKVKVSAPAPSIPNSNSSWTLNCGTTLCPILSYPILSLYFSQRTQFRGTQSTRGSILAFVYVHRRILAGSARGRKDNRWQRGQRDGREGEKEGGRRRERVRERERKRQEEIRYCQTVAAVGAASTQAPCARESIALTHSIVSKGVGWVGRGRRGRKGVAIVTILRYLAARPQDSEGAKIPLRPSAYCVASIPSRTPLSPSPSSFIPLSVSASICSFLVSSSSSPVPLTPFRATYRAGVFSYETTFASPPPPPLLCLLNSCVGCT